MDCPKDVINLIFQLYMVDHEIEFEYFEKRLNEWIIFFQTHYDTLLKPIKEELHERSIIKLNYEELLELNAPPSSEGFKKEFYLTPEITLLIISSSVHLLLLVHKFGSCIGLVNGQWNKSFGDIRNYLFLGNRTTKIVTRIYNYRPIIRFSLLRSHTLNCVASLVGQIVKVSRPKIIVTNSLFTCNKCNTSFFKYFKNGFFELPNKCVNRECDNYLFTLNKNNTITTTCQVIRLQEYVLDSNSNESITNNSTIDFHITDDLIGKYNLGNIVNVMGTIKLNDEFKSNCNNNKLVHNLYIKAISVSVISGGSNGDKIDKRNFIGFIREIYYNEPNKFYLVATSLFPNLNGKYYQKVGLLLSILGATNIHFDMCSGLGNVYPSSFVPKKRGLIHILMIGEPGVGKSHMLLNISSLGNHIISGSNITNSGLTVGVTKTNNQYSNNYNNFGNNTASEYNLEAGLLLLFNNSILCIDELDKLYSTDMLLEVMEDQRISIAKAGIVKRFKASTTLICSLNPIYSKYNFNKGILDNIKLSKTLLSRFDLIFLLINDKKDYDDYYNNSSDDTDMIRKLKSFQKFDFLNNVLINEYLEYSKNYVVPKFTKESKRMLKDFIEHLLSLYKNNSYSSYYSNNQESNSTSGNDSNSNNVSSGTDGGNTLKITIRQIQGLIRLCQSRARGDLTDVITEEHVEEVIEIFKNTIYYPIYLKNLYGTNSSLNVELKRERKPNRKILVKCFINELRKLLNNQTAVIPNYEMYDLAKEIVATNNSSLDPDELIYEVNNLGYLLKEGTSWRTNL